MPTYNYACETCGPFTAMQKLAAFDQPAACPACGIASVRSFGVPDSLLSGRRMLRASDGAPAGDAGSYPRMRHGGSGCACCP